MRAVTVTTTPNPHLFSSLHGRSAGQRSGRGGGRGPSKLRFRVSAYLEKRPNSAVSIVSKVIGSLPVVGLLARIFSDEGGVGSDLIDFAEFRRQVGKKCGVTDSRAFYEFQERRGRRTTSLLLVSEQHPQIK